MHSLKRAPSTSMLTESDTTHRSVCVLSPGKEDEQQKNQDRIALKAVQEQDGSYLQFAVVCDGITTSPYAAEAAEYVVEQVESLLHREGLKQVVDHLQNLREKLISKPIELGDQYGSELLKNIFADIVHDKYQRSYQTTFISVCLAQRDQEVSVTAAGCGDSALFIFKENGELLYNNINVATAGDPFEHNSPFTAVLPDSFDETRTNVLLENEQYGPDVQLLLCSDGFYDAFKNFGEIYEWLHAHQQELTMAHDVNGPLLEELHTRLNQTKGDDDISFIWLLPRHNWSSDDVVVQPEVSVPTRCEAQNGLIGRLHQCLLSFGRPGKR